MVAVTTALVSSGLPLGGRYRLDDRIAVGGMGEVWRATDLVLARLVAVKLLHPGHAEREEELVRFRAEARHAGSLAHPGIAQVYDYREADPPDPPYLVMELVDGQSLARLLDEGPVGLARTLDLIAQAARALQAAHAAGLVHRDIKPGNLLVSRSGQVKITDFGIAHAAGAASLTCPGALIGTPAYLAPERAVGAPATPAADLYGLGIVAFQCLTGELPFSGPPLAVALAHREQPMPPLPPWVPAGVATLVADLTAKDPRARPASAAEVAARAGQLRTALTVPATRRRGKKDGRHGRLLVRAVLATAAAVAIAAAGWMMTGVHGQTSVNSHSRPPAVSRQPALGGSHSAHRVVAAGGTGIASAAGGPARTGRSTASHESPAPNVASSRTLKSTGTPTPTETTASAGTTATPSGTAAPTGTLAPTGTPTPSGTPAPTGTAATSGAPTQSGTSTSVPSS